MTEKSKQFCELDGPSCLWDLAILFGLMEHFNKHNVNPEVRNKPICHVNEFIGALKPNCNCS